ncbi:MAG: TonB-dependent receptor [Tahibacter sp.]
MSRSLPRSAFAAVLSVAAFAAGPALAEDAMAAEENLELSEGSSGSRKKDGRTVHGNVGPWVGETIHVTAKGTAADWPSTLATEVVNYADALAAPSDFQDLIVRVPGVAATGQNGIFETFSIRGSGGNEILILVGGMPITAQRRAGVPVAFVEPSLLGDINVTRGPSVVHFGPGALGGAVSIEPRWFDAATVSAGYATAGEETSLMAGIGSDSFSIGVARHRAGDSKSADDVPLNTSFERDSATAQFRKRFGDFEFDALLMPSRTENIGKSNSRYPTRNTTYPEDSHTLGRIRLRHENGFEASIHGHDQYLGTRNQRPNFADTFAAVSSTDVGSTVQQSFDIGDFNHDVGIEFLGRRNVDGYDATSSVNNRRYTLKGARENSWSLFALTDWTLTPQFALEFGGRYTTNEQKQSAASTDDSASALTAGAAWTPNASNRWTVNLASGYRFSTLEERFFSGVTPQGQIVGNPDLASEHSLGIDVGHAWQSGDWGSEIHVWRLDVDDLIQQIQLQPGVNGYVNVGEGNLYGAEATLDWTPTSDLSLRATGTWARGEDGNGTTLYGISPTTGTLEARYKMDDFTVGAYVSHRSRVNRPGFEEVKRDSVNVVDADLRYRVSPQWDLQLYLRNAFDEDYYATSDVLSAFAQERTLGLNVVWTAH